MAGRSKKKSKADSGGFSTLLTWTVLLALVFSAGLITGQRLLREQAMPPLVSLSVTGAQAAEIDDAAGGDEKSPLKASFSFYKHLSEREARPEAGLEAPAAKPAPKPVAENPQEKPQEKPAPVAAKPPEEAPAATQEVVEKVAEKVEQKPAEEPSAAERLLDTVTGALDAPAEKTAAGSGAGSDVGSDAGLPARYTLQIGSHPDSASAQRDMDRLRKAGLEPHVIMVEVPGKGRIYRVRVGKFHSMDEARGFQASLSQERGVASFVSPL